MNWRQWIYLALTTDAAIIAVAPVASIVAGGSLTGSPRARPFIVIRVGEETPDLVDDSIPVTTSRSGSIWVYDEPGSYDRIDSIIKMIRDRLTGQVSEPGGIAAVWAGDSPELADDEMSAIVRNTNYRLVGSEA